MPQNTALRDFYRSTPMREGILCWYPFESDARVLDASGGVLGELIERRCGLVVDLDVAGGGEYDYVAVLDPVDFSVEALAAFRARLKPDGRLLLAYENPFALRYWAGKAAPNTALPYDTLFGLGESPLPSRQEMRTRLTRAGFAGQKWYYPLTDHWFAREIYSESYLPNEYLNQRFIPYMADDECLRFDERGLYREVIRGGAFEFMCGAYLVEARRDAASLPCSVDYAAVTAYREPSKRFATIVRNDGIVHKSPLHPDGLESIRRIHRNHEDLAALGVDVVETRVVDGSLVMPRLNLPTLWDYWADKLSRGVFDEGEMIRHFDRIRESILRASANGRCYWELVPANCFYDAKTDRLRFFDQEYYYDGASPDVAVARAIGAINYSSSVFRNDPRSERWLNILLDRYGLAEQRDALFSTVVPKTDIEVFGHGADALAVETERAVSGIFERKKALATRSASRRRRERFSSVPDILRKMGYHSPIVYGQGKRGQALAGVLAESGMEIAATVDRKNNAFSSIDLVPPEVNADVLIVSVLGGQTLADELKKKTHLPIYTLEELIDE